jgi:hypothetical protein
MSDLLNSASLVMIPSGYKEDVVYSQIPTDGSGDLSFTRASNGTRINSAGLVEVCPWNLCTYSEDQTQWTSQNATTVTANTTTAPNGTLTADTVTPTAGYDDHYNGIGLSSQVGELTAFIYVKPNGYNFFDWGIWNQSSYLVRATFDLVNLTYTFTNAGTATIESVGNGWLKCGISGSNASLSTIDLYYRVRPTGGAGFFTGNGTSGAFIWGAQLNIGSTAKPYFPTTDRLNVPRLTYQNGGGGCPSLLLEKQSTNIATYSEDATQWNKGSNVGSITVTADQTISPDGTQNADKVQFPAVGSGSQYAVLFFPFTATATAYTGSMWLKGNSGGEVVWLNFTKDGINYTQTLCTLTTSWQRFTLSSTLTSGADNFQIGVDTRDSAESAKPAQTIFVWGRQLEQSSYPTSYIPTTSSSATRVADACLTASVTSLIGQTEGVMFIDFNKTASLANSFFLLSNIAGTTAGSYQNGVYIFQIENSALVCDGFMGNVQQFGFILSALSIGRHKIAVAYKANDFAIYVDGVLAGTDTSGTVPQMNYLTIGGGVDVANQSQSVNQVALFKTKLTNAELIALTTL